MKRKILALVAIIFLGIITSDCTTLTNIHLAIYHDQDHPCSPGEYRNMVECELWQQKYPREFAAYEKRMKLRHKRDSINQLHLPPSE